MRATIFVVVLAMLAMVNALPVQEEKNLQGLLNVLEDQKESTAQVANLVKQQQDDDGSQEAGAQFFRKLLSLYANKQDGRAEAQIIGRLIKSFWANKQQDDDNGNQADAQFHFHIYANKQQDDDNGNQAEAQFIGRLIKSFWANKQQDDDNGNQADAQFHFHVYADKQQDDDNADAQFWTTLLRLAAPHAVNYVAKKLG